MKEGILAEDREILSIGGGILAEDKEILLLRERIPAKIHDN
jgi:hypothetical protein